MLAGVFSLFATMGFVQLLMAPVKQTVLSTLTLVCIYGGFAVGYALLSTLRKFRWLPWWGFAAGLLVLNPGQPVSPADTRQSCKGR